MTPNLASNTSCHEGCQVLPLYKPVTAEQVAQAETAFLLIHGVGCPACVTRVRNGLLQVEGVIAAEVVFEGALTRRSFAKVWYDSSVIQVETVVTRLPDLADDTHHHYTAQPVVISGPPRRMKSAQV